LVVRQIIKWRAWVLIREGGRQNMQPEDNASDFEKSLILGVSTIEPKQSDMKNILLLSLCGLLFSFQTPKDEGMTKADRDYAVSYFKQTKAKLFADVKGLSQNQLQYRVDSTRWSIAQCLEHIALAETYIWQYEQMMLRQPADPSKRSTMKFSNDQLIQAVTDRSKKFNAPEPLRPVGKFANSEDALKSFELRRDSTISYLETTQDDVKDHFIMHPVFGTMDIYQGLLLIAGHCARHTLQIEEVKASPNFPKS